MPFKSAARRLVLSLIAVALVAPVGICLLVALGWLLAATGDAPGAAMLERIALGGGVLWVLDLVCLLLVLAIATLAESNEPPEEP